MKNKNIIAVTNLIRCLSLDSLKNYEVVANLVRAFGLVQWGQVSCGKDEIFKNSTVDMAGIFQLPNQIAKALVYLSDFEVNTYVEVGTFQGGNFIFCYEYLKRFNPNIRGIGIDPTNYLNPEIKAIIDSDVSLSFKSVTSEALAGQSFDLVFIDADHTLSGVTKDWNNVGRFAKICIFHDIQGPICPDIVKFWNGLKEKFPDRKTVEFLDYGIEGPTKGIGIIHNPDASEIKSPKIHLVMPFYRKNQKKVLADMYRPMNVIWHPIIFQDEVIKFNETWIDPVIIPMDSTGDWGTMEVQNVKRNWFIQNCDITDSDYYVAVDDDDMYEPNVFDEVKKMQDDIVVISMKRGQHIPSGVELKRYYPTSTLIAKPEAVKVGEISNQQSFVKGNIFKKYLYDDKGHCGDGRLAVRRKESGEQIAYRPDLYALFNYYEPGRWDK